MYFYLQFRCLSVSTLLALLFFSSAKEKIEYAFDKSYCNQGGIIQCDYYLIITHGITVFHGQIFFLFDEFSGKSCFEITHLDECKGLWNPSRRTGKIQVGGGYTVHTYHPIYNRYTLGFGGDMVKS